MSYLHSKSLLMFIISIIAVSVLTLSLEVSAVSNEKFEFDPITEIRRTQFDHNGDLIILGYTSENDIAVAKISSNGTLLWDDVFGGSALETADDFVIDENNNIYLTGITSSTDFPTTNNAFQPLYGGNDDIFIRILNSDGEVLLSSFLGGSDSEQLTGWINPLKLTSDNKIIFVGETNSMDIEMKNAFQPDYVVKEGSLGPRGNLLITKFSYDGTVDWTSYFGASGEVWVQLKLDADDNILLYGDVQGVGLPGVEDGQFQFRGVRDEFISKIAPNGEIIFTKYLGGSAIDWGMNFDIDSQGNIVTLGSTASRDYDTSENAFQPNFAGNWDLFINKFNPNGEIIWSSYFGGTGNDNIGSCCSANNDANKIEDRARFILDSNDDIVLVTKSNSLDLPLTNAYDNSINIDNAYLTKISGNGSVVIFGTYLGGIVSDILLTKNNEILITGNTGDPNLPTTINASRKTFGGLFDGYYLRLLANGSVVHSSYLGGSGRDVVVKGILTDNDKLLIIGATDSIDMPSAINSYSGDTDIFVCSINQLGAVEFCRYLGGEASDLINRSGILIDDFGNIFLIGITRSKNLNIPTPPPTSYEQAALVAQFDATGTENWRDVYIPQTGATSTNDEIDLMRYMIIGSIFTALVLTGYLIRSYYVKSKAFENSLLNTNMINILSPIFNSKPQLIHIFGVAKIFKEDKIHSQIQSDLPREILDFKYFLHPVRLSIIKLLDENSNLTTVQLKDFLGLSWNEILFHVDSLKKAEYITINQQFVDGSIRSIITAESKVISQYASLKEILHNFLDATPNLERYLEHVNEVKMRSDDADLYPSNN